MGGLDGSTSIAFYFDLAGKELAKGGGTKSGYIQFLTTFKHSNGEHRFRVTTIQRPFVSPGDFKNLATGFDQEVACVMMARMCIVKSEQGEESMQLLKWLDRSLVRLVMRFATYRKDDISSFRLSNEFMLYP